MSNQGECCLVAHAQATPPWTCSCPCHNRKDKAEPDNIASSGLDLEHLAFSILHGTFNQDVTGGCSCDLCTRLRTQRQ